MGKLPFQLGKLGSMLGILAGLMEMCIGVRILSWIGNKQNPTILGLITFFLSGVAFLSVVSARKRVKPSNDRKLLIFLGVLLPAAICFTTVGRLWYLPGSILIMTCILLVYEYWFGQSKDNSKKIFSKKFWINQIVGGIGSLIILVSVVLGFFNSSFGLFKSEILVNTSHFRFEVLPMDILRSTNLSGRVTASQDIEVSLVMIVYIILILGASIAFISSLVNSRLFKGIGGTLVFAGLILFLFWLPGIISQTEITTISFRYIMGSLGLGWYISIVGMSLIMISSLLPCKLLK